MADQFSEQSLRTQYIDQPLLPHLVGGNLAEGRQRQWRRAGKHRTGQYRRRFKLCRGAADRSLVAQIQREAEPTAASRHSFRRRCIAVIGHHGCETAIAEQVAHG